MTGLRVLVTGHDGYLGSVLVPLLREAGHDVVGLDMNLLRGCSLGPEPEAIPSLSMDIRGVTSDYVRGLDAIVHLAGLCNDPVGDLRPSATGEINHEGSVRLARAAKKAGVERIVLSSSCSVYGSAGSGIVDEESTPRPVTAYGMSKLGMEQGIAPLADDEFSPTFLRYATAYGASPRMRSDLVVNNLAGRAWLTGEILIMSDGTPWRPLVHVQDIARAILAVLAAPRGRVHGQVINVGATPDNYRVDDLAGIVAEVVGGSRIAYRPGGGPDLRSYRVDFGKLEALLPEARPRWDVAAGVRELVEAFDAHGLTAETFFGPALMRVSHFQALREAGDLDDLLQWRRPRAGIDA